jgi:hypothetical protein
MKLHPFPPFVFAVALFFAGCGEPEKSQRAEIGARPMRAGGDFDEVGKVSFFQGESCASQIMFVFHGGRSASIAVAAPFRVSKVLTDAARDHRSVHVWGKWRRGRAQGCSYVEATQVEVQKTFW